MEQAGRRRVRSDVPRRRQVVVRFSDAELAVVRERAASAGLAVGAWIGQTVLDDVRQGSGSVWALPDLLRLHADVVAVERTGVVDRGRLDDLLVRLEAVVETAAGGDTKTRGSRRTLALPERCVEVLEEHRDRQRAARNEAGERWVDRDLVFATEAGTAMDAANVRRDFQRVAVAAGLDDRRWSPRELRHSFVSLLSDGGVPIEEIARLIGHTGGSKVTESVYRKQLRPVIEEGARAMNRVFPGRRRDSYSASYSSPPGTPRRPGQDPQRGR